VERVAITMDEAELIRKCDQGDPLAQAELIRSHSAKIGRLLARLAGPGGDVEDLLQVTFIQAFGSIGTFRGEASLSTWLCSIALRVAMSRRRREKRRKAILAACGKVVFLLGRASEQGAESPENDMERKHDAAQFVYSVLGRLPDKFRDVLVLHELEEMSGRDIAAVMGIKENTVWTRLYRARELFKEKALEMGFREGEWEETETHENRK
jgi:RNA polymerase sigma-70 factor (ECF subfamily)